MKICAEKMFNDINARIKPDTCLQQPAWYVVVWKGLCCYKNNKALHKLCYCTDISFEYRIKYGMDIS